MNAICHESGPIEPEHLNAARKLMQEVVRDYGQLIESGKKLKETTDLWKITFAVFRQFERKAMIQSEPSEDTTRNHLACMNDLILCADMISSVCGRYLEINCHIEAEEKADVLAQIDLINRHRSILAFEFKSWTPIPKEVVEKAERELFGESGRKAA